MCRQIARSPANRLPINMDGTNQSPASPLDPIMVVFLEYVQSLASGFAPGVQSREAASSAGVPDALIDAVFVSARTRGLIGRDFNAKPRTRTRWIVSPRGRDFIIKRTEKA